VIGEEEEEAFDDCLRGEVTGTTLDGFGESDWDFEWVGVARSPSTSLTAIITAKKSEK
jgi:hypothetical protein